MHKNANRATYNVYVQGSTKHFSVPIRNCMSTSCLPAVPLPESLDVDEVSTLELPLASSPQLTAPAAVPLITVVHTVPLAVAHLPLRQTPEVRLALKPVLGVTTHERRIGVEIPAAVFLVACVVAVCFVVALKLLGYTRASVMATKAGARIQLIDDAILLVVEAHGVIGTRVLVTSVQAVCFTVTLDVGRETRRDVITTV